MYSFEISDITDTEIEEFEQVVLEIEEITFGKKKNWDGVSDSLMIFFSTISGTVITASLTYILKKYREGRVKIKHHEYEVECHQENLDDVASFISSLEKVSRQRNGKKGKN